VGEPGLPLTQPIKPAPESISNAVVECAQIEPEVSLVSAAEMIASTASLKLLTNGSAIRRRSLAIPKASLCRATIRLISGLDETRTAGYRQVVNQCVGNEGSDGNDPVQEIG
jgi:hypothetical protein